LNPELGIYALSIGLANFEYQYNLDSLIFNLFEAQKYIICIVKFILFLYYLFFLKYFLNKAFD
jgi:hypothetical protein